MVAENKRHLAKLLKNDRRGLIVSMIHKFDGMEADACLRKNVFVLVDEAHRTTGGDLGNYLMGAIPNATYLGFTGTPIDRTAHGKGTFKVFGLDDPKGYLDKYSIRESVEDGTTVPLHYSLAPNELRVDREVSGEGVLGVERIGGRQRHRRTQPSPGPGRQSEKHAEESGAGRQCGPIRCRTFPQHD